MVAEKHAGDDRARGTHDSESQESRSTLRVERVARLSESCVPHAHQSAKPTARKQRGQANPVPPKNPTRNYQVGSCGSRTRRKEPRGSRWKDPRSVKRHVSPTDRDRGPDELGFRSSVSLTSPRKKSQTRS
jgi:hypothetical protein